MHEKKGAAHLCSSLLAGGRVLPSFRSPLPGLYGEWAPGRHPPTRAISLLSEQLQCVPDALHGLPKPRQDVLLICSSLSTGCAAVRVGNHPLG